MTPRIRISSAHAVINSRSAAINRPSLMAISLLALTGCLLTDRAAASERSECQQPIATAETAAASSSFRLGTAAAPFGWATAIADFNADGQPDFAVVDRAGSTAGYQYDIDVKLSSASSQRFALTSFHEAVTVVVVDIDHDNDLDIVITPALTREVVVAWLNDGFGRFNPATLRDAPSFLPAERVIAARRSVAAAQPAIAPPRVLLACPCSVDSAPDTAAPNGDVVSSNGPSSQLVLSSFVAPRAPPFSF